MNKHQEIKALLPFYVSGQLSQQEFHDLSAHLSECAACRDELALWQDTSEAIAEGAPAATASPQVLLGALETIHQAQCPNALQRAWQLIKAQLPLVRREIWPASLLVLALGFVITLVVDNAAFLFAIAPLVSAYGLAFIYNKASDPAYELVLATPVSPLQILLSRSALVFAYNFALVLLLALVLSLIYSAAIVLPLLLDWLAPMTFLSTLGLCLSIFGDAESAIITVYTLWLLRYMLITAEFKQLFGRLGDLFLLTWQSPGLLYGFSMALMAVMLLYLKSNHRRTRQLS